MWKSSERGLHVGRMFFFVVDEYDDRPAILSAKVGAKNRALMLSIRHQNATAETDRLRGPQF
jgi:hypothetical protein